MTEGVATPSDADAAAQRAAEQARLRKERREAKIKAGGSARLNKIMGNGGRPPVPGEYLLLLALPSRDHFLPILYLSFLDKKEKRKRRKKEEEEEKEKKKGNTDKQGRIRSFGPGSNSSSNNGS